MLKIALRPSWLLAATLVIAHACAVGLIWLVDLPITLTLAATATLLAAGAFAVWRYALLRGRVAVIALEVTSDHVMNAQTRVAGWLEYDVLGSTFVTSFLTVINLRDVEGSRHNVVVLPDSLHADDYRKLRVWLRWKDERARERGVP